MLLVSFFLFGRISRRIKKFPACFAMVQFLNEKYNKNESMKKRQGGCDMNSMFWGYALTMILGVLQGLPSIVIIVLLYLILKELRGGKNIKKE